uniref:Uncharacterized protein n=1 Tax=Anopheles albimanus TaxID=7167 RepID=A0A182FT69_ANOAL
MYLRMGRASDVNPLRVLHVIARRRKPGGAMHQDLFLPSSKELNEESMHELETCRMQLLRDMSDRLHPRTGNRTYEVAQQSAAEFNRHSKPEIIAKTLNEWDSDRYLEKVVIGEDVLKLNLRKAHYNLHFPIRRGEFNIHNNIGGSLFSVLTDLQIIWEFVLFKMMSILSKDISRYKAVLVVPDIYNRIHLGEYMTLLLKRIGFGSCFIVQDHVSATFGAGLGYACVVDVGDQKTSVSCVEDGISHPQTRVRFDYGGGDVSQVLYWLLKKCNFPYQEYDEQNLMDTWLLQHLKENYGHFFEGTMNNIEKRFVVHQPCTEKRIYTFRSFDEFNVAPLSLFYIELLTVTGANKALPKTQKLSSLQPHPEDCFDAEYLRETGRRNKETLEHVSIEAAADNPDDEIGTDGLEQEHRNNDWDYWLQPNGQLVGLEQAIVQSVEPSEELKRKMYGCILIVGGGLKFSGLRRWLQQKLSEKIPAAYRSEQCIIISPKDIDSEITSWRGAAIMSCLESASELWLSESEWTQYGWRVLREKTVFLW